MGADLITYILVGPEKVTLSEFKKAKLLKRCEAFVAVAHKACAQHDGEVDPGSGYFNDDVLNKSERKMLAGADVQFLEEAACLEPEKVLVTFLKLWNISGNRDSNTRTFRTGGKTWQILVAGDMSWGDEPDGYDYQTIKDALALGIPYQLGIQ